MFLFVSGASEADDAGRLSCCVVPEADAHADMGDENHRTPDDHARTLLSLNDPKPEVNNKRSPRVVGGTRPEEYLRMGLALRLARFIPVQMLAWAFRRCVIEPIQAARCAKEPKS
jgi:hypothetical protein